MFVTLLGEPNIFILSWPFRVTLFACVADVSSSCEGDLQWADSCYNCAFHIPSWCTKSKFHRPRSSSCSYTESYSLHTLLSYCLCWLISSAWKVVTTYQAARICLPSLSSNDPCGTVLFYVYLSISVFQLSARIGIHPHCVIKTVYIYLRKRHTVYSELGVIFQQFARQCCHWVWSSVRLNPVVPSFSPLLLLPLLLPSPSLPSPLLPSTWQTRIHIKKPRVDKASGLIVV